MIDTIVNLNRGDGDIHITWIYGRTRWDDHRELWEKLKVMAQTKNGPWMCVGYFNEISS